MKKAFFIFLVFLCSHGNAYASVPETASAVRMSALSAERLLYSNHVPTHTPEAQAEIKKIEKELMQATHTCHACTYFAQWLLKQQLKKKYSATTRGDDFSYKRNHEKKQLRINIKRLDPKKTKGIK